MASTLEVLRFSDILGVTAVSKFLPNLTPPAIEVVGEDFSSASEVLVNGTSAYSFVVIDRKKMLVQFPLGVTGLRTIEVLSDSFTQTRENSKLQFRVLPMTRVSTGLQKLLQEFMIVWFTTPGSDAFNPEFGGGLQQILRSLRSGVGIHPGMSALVQSVDRTRAQITQYQSRLRDLPLSERLASATVSGHDLSRGDSSARIQIKITSLEGTNALASFAIKE